MSYEGFVMNWHNVNSRTKTHVKFDCGRSVVLLHLNVGGRSRHPCVKHSCHSVRVKRRRHTNEDYKTDGRDDVTVNPFTRTWP